MTLQRVKRALVCGYVYMDCACLSVVLVLVCSLPDVGIRIRLMGKVSLVSTWSWCSCVAMSYGGGSFSPDVAADSALDSVMLMKGKYSINFFQYQTVRCVAVWWWRFHSLWCLRLCLGQRESDAWKIRFHLFPVSVDVGCVCMLNGWFSSNDDICADYFFFSRFQLKGKCRSVKWVVYLYCDMTIMVVRSQVQFLAV